MLEARGDSRGAGGHWKEAANVALGRHPLFAQGAAAP
jgi:hypothetical protein